jgi:hypothetical protein
MSAISSQEIKYYTFVVDVPIYPFIAIGNDKLRSLMKKPVSRQTLHLRVFEKHILYYWDFEAFELELRPRANVRDGEYKELGLVYMKVYILTLTLGLTLLLLVSKGQNKQTKERVFKH